MSKIIMMTENAILMVNGVAEMHLILFINKIID